LKETGWLPAWLRQALKSAASKEIDHPRVDPVPFEQSSPIKYMEITNEDQASFSKNFHRLRHGLDSSPFRNAIGPTPGGISGCPCQPIFC
jgi:hypothetical protein